MRKNKFLELQNGSDIRGVALPGVEGEEVNLTKLEAMRIGASFANWLTYKAEYQSPEPENLCGPGSKAFGR